MESAQLSGPGPGIVAPILLLLAGWAPIFVAARLLGVRLRPGRLAMGAALAAFVGGMCCLELRRHGLLALPLDAITVPNNGLALHEIIRFALMGAAGALGCEVLLSRIRGPGSPPTGQGRGTTMNPLDPEVRGTYNHRSPENLVIEAQAGVDGWRSRPAQYGWRKQLENRQPARW